MCIFLSLEGRGEWYFWGKVIAPSVADNSFHWGIDIADADAVAQDNANVNIMISNAELLTALTDTYTQTLTVTVTPI